MATPHEPQATHLAMLEALATRSHLQLTYHQALEHGYLWHEFWRSPPIITLVEPPEELFLLVRKGSSYVSL
ncbi:hypothetical protein KDW_32580 [Dictyobacter vulcani]|uniref:Uncharacterized protein n=1 Tax=Dictyobacter vulcani TaxID=2607529 RepID=A0A5J4KV90_9CHLR|nr:S-adenosylmethionine:tRNA ribosyltransferase-isomerase [Dictyobacter vulcani]GER89096.1 hypothetical protein KDW_32580 [Dictyobacter vulcani]